MTGYVHFGAAIIAIVLGLVIFLMRKGTLRHRRTGLAYVSAMLIVNAVALTIYEDSPAGLGMFHYLALVSLATLAAAFGAIRIGRAERHRVVHAFTMAWSYAGLLAAGVGQGATAFGLSPGLPILVTLVVAGVLIHVLVPRSPLLRGSVRTADPA